MHPVLVINMPSLAVKSVKTIIIIIITIKIIIIIIIIIIITIIIITIIIITIIIIMIIIINEYINKLNICGIDQLSWFSMEA